MKRVFACMLIGVLIFSCSKEDDITEQIIGNWKLTEAKFYGLQNGNSSESSIDYTAKNIIYRFQGNGILIVTCEENVGHANGEYEYFFGETYLGSSSDPKSLLVKINNSKWTYRLTNGKMTLGMSYVDGPNLVFEKI